MPAARGARPTFTVPRDPTLGSHRIVNACQFRNDGGHCVSSVVVFDVILTRALDDADRSLGRRPEAGLDRRVTKYPRARTVQQGTARQEGNRGVPPAGFEPAIFTLKG